MASQVWNKSNLAINVVDNITCLLIFFMSDFRENAYNA